MSNYNYMTEFDYVRCDCGHSRMAHVSNWCHAMTADGNAQCYCRHYDQMNWINGFCIIPEKISAT